MQFLLSSHPLFIAKVVSAFELAIHRKIKLICVFFYPSPLDWYCVHVHAGSGDLAALGILEDGFKPNMEVPVNQQPCTTLCYLTGWLPFWSVIRTSHFFQMERAKDLVRAAIQAGIMDDLGSGNNIDICVITKEGVDYLRPYQESQFKDNRYAVRQ